MGVSNHVSEQNTSALGSRRRVKTSVSCGPSLLKAQLKTQHTIKPLPVNSSSAVPACSGLHACMVLTNRRGNRSLRAPGEPGAPSDIRETHLANASVCICVMESVNSLTTQNCEFFSGAEFCKLVNPLIITMQIRDLLCREIINGTL